jgi:hypothetical protein
MVEAKGGTHNCQLAGEATVGKMKNVLGGLAIVQTEQQPGFRNGVVETGEPRDRDGQWSNESDCDGGAKVNDLWQTNCVLK